MISQDVPFASALKTLPSSLFEALTTNALADPGVLRSYPWTHQTVLGLAPVEPTFWAEAGGNETLRMRDGCNF